MNVPIVLNVPNKESWYARIVVAIYSNDPNEPYETINSNLLDGMNKLILLRNIYASD